MVAQLTTADMMQVAYNTGAAGKTAPPWVTRDRDYARAFARGRQSAGLENEDQPDPTPAPTTPGPRRPISPRSRPRARSRSRSRFRVPRGRRGAVTGWFTGRGGTGGGLLLAVFAYPIGLAVLQHGSAGAGMWFKAKFLNKTSSTQPVPASGTPGNSGKTGTGATSSGNGASSGGGGSW